MEPDRVIVAQAPSPREIALTGRLPVGVVRWAGPAPALTVVVKLTLSFAADDDGSARLAETQEPLSANRLATLEGGRTKLVYPSDLVPYKEDADVLLYGHAYASPEAMRYETDANGAAAPTTRIEAMLEMGDQRRQLLLVAKRRRDKVPLVAPYLRDPTSPENEAPAAGPVATAALLAPPDWHAPDFDFTAYNAACPLQRVPWLLPGARLGLFGLSPRAEERAIALPDFTPRVFADFADRDEAVELALVCDTVHIDTDAEVAILLWRGEVPLTRVDANDLERLVVTLDPVNARRSRDEILRALPRGEFFYAVGSPDLAPGAAPVPDESPELAAARYGSWGHPHAPDPALPLVDFARISAELGEQREPRTDTLRRHRLNEDAWTIEERAWLESMAVAGAEPEGGIAAEYGRLFVEEQDKLAGPEEARLTLSDYARIRAQSERRDPARVLRDEKMTLPVWLRFDRRVRAQVGTDVERREEVARMIDAERLRVVPDAEDDEET